MENEPVRDEFEQAVQADMMVNTMIRIARDLERMLAALIASASLLGLIAGILVYRLMVGK